MKILDNALTGGWPKKLVCSDCKSQLEIETSDLRHDEWKVSGYHFDGSAVCRWLYTFKCPVCGQEANGNEVPENEIPLDVRNKLRSKR